MSYVKIENGNVASYPYTIKNLKEDNPNTSFPKNLTEEALNSFGVYSVTYAANPSYDSKTQKVVSATTPTNVDGVWTITKSVESLSSDEVNSLTLAEEGNLRLMRSELLKDSDWTQMPDSPLTAEKKTEWATYREALRNVTSADNWPWISMETDWPTPPSE